MSLVGGVNIRNLRRAQSSDRQFQMRFCKMLSRKPTSLASRSQSPDSPQVAKLRTCKISMCQVPERATLAVCRFLVCCCASRLQRQCSPDAQVLLTVKAYPCAAVSDVRVHGVNALPVKYNPLAVCSQGISHPNRSLYLANVRVQATNVYNDRSTHDPFAVLPNQNTEKL